VTWVKRLSSGPFSRSLGSRAIAGACEKRWTPAATGAPEVLRGSEWYLFEGERISEIRSYHNNFYLQGPGNRQLHDFDYAGRGYRVE